MNINHYFHDGGELIKNEIDQHQWRKQGRVKPNNGGRGGMQVCICVFAYRDKNVPDDGQYI